MSDTAPPPPEGAPKKRPLLHPTNQRLGILVLVVIGSAFLFRFNGCDSRSVAKKVVKEQEFRTLIEQVAALDARAVSIENTQRQLAATAAAIDGKLDKLLAHSDRIVYRFNPAKDAQPSDVALKRLRDAIGAAAAIHVMRRPAAGAGHWVTYDCATTRVDTNGNVQCTSSVLSANAELPDGRRYQEVVQHDGTITLAHWNADGSNVQGATLGRQEVVWVAALPLAQ